MRRSLILAGVIALALVMPAMGARAQDQAAPTSATALAPAVVSIPALAPAPARRSAGRSFAGSIAAIDPVARTITLQGKEGAIMITGETDIHLMRPADAASLTTSSYALASGVVAPDRKSMDARNMSLYYKKGVMVDYIHADQVRGTMTREGERIAIEANGQVVEVNLAKPLRLMASQPLKFEELKPGDQVSGWAIETPDGTKAQLLFVERI